MSIEIIPPGSSAVVTESYRKDHDHDSDRYRTHDRFAQVGRDIKDTRYDIVQEMTKGFAATAVGFAHTDEEMQEGFCDIKDKVGQAASAVTAAVFHGVEEAQENYAATQKQISDSATSTLVGFKDLTALAYQVEGRALLEAAKNASALSVQADKNAYQLQLQAQTFSAAAQLEAVRNTNALSVQADKNSAAIQLQATVNASAALAAMAECCCELKELIRGDGQATRDLINAQEVGNLRDRANKAELALALAEACKRDK